MRRPRSLNRITLEKPFPGDSPGKISVAFGISIWPVRDKTFGNNSTEQFMQTFMRRKLGIAAFQLAFLSGGLIAAEAATETLPASVIRATTATLNGSTNPEGIETAAWF